MAVPVDQATKDALQAPVKQLRSEVSYTENDETTTLTSEDRIISIKKEAEGYYFQSTLRKITIVTTGTDMELLDKQVKVDIFVKTGTNTWGRLPWGSFNITEATVNEDKGTTTYVGYDGVYSLQTRNYVGGELEFPTTVEELAEAMATSMGIELVQDLSTLPNHDAPISEDLWANITGTTYRDILDEIAGATGTIAEIGNGDDTLDFNQPPIDAPTDTMTEDNLVTFKIGPEWGPVNAVVLSRQPQGDNIEVVDEIYMNRTAAGANLMPLTATPGSTTSNGVTFTVEEDGTLTVNGKNNGRGNSSRDIFRDNTNKLKLKAGTYRFVPPQNSNIGFVFHVGTSYYDFESNNSWTRTFESDMEVEHIYIQVRRNNTAQFTNTKAYPMLTTMEHPTAADWEPFQPLPRTDIVIANNEILDDQRETTATPILNAVKGWGYREATLKTEGHGYHEVGDRIDVTIGNETYKTIITKSVVIIDGGINETLTSTTPTVDSIDYSKTGGITKTIYNTELAVDKQGQEIVGIVSRQDITDETVAENYTQLLQTISSIIQTVQVSGGGNLIRNSVGFGKAADGTLTIWQYGPGADTTTVNSQSSTASLNAGAISAHEININGASISQTVQLTAGDLYNLSFRIQKDAPGSATVTIDDGVTITTLTAEASTAYTWNQLNADFIPQTGSVTITLTATGGAAAFTDLMLAQGGITSWRQASGEIYNLQVSVDADGVQVRSTTYSGDYVQITPLEFAGYSNAGGVMKKVFTVNRDTTEVAKLQAESMIKMPPMEIVPIDNANYKGWAIVKAAE